MTGLWTAGHDRPRSHAIQNALVAAAILAEFVLILGHPLFGWGSVTYAATPRPLVFAAPQPPSAQAVLLALSAAAAKQPAALTSPEMRYAYVRRREWRLATRRRGESPPTVVSPTMTESWTAADGSGRVLTSKPTGATVADVTVAAGHPLVTLPANGVTLTLLLGMASPAAVPSARQFVAFADLSDRQPISPLVESTILRLLALTPGVVDSGTVTDRDGRRGVALSVESGYTGVEVLYSLIFDQSTGKLLEADQTLSGDPGVLDVPQGSVLAYKTFLTSGHVANTTARPAG
ncbi:MAG TPA: hypothetical protein VG294_19990 [Solirubrobacteraceae bacterium]|jgi:hypothetical protein|nr:hypothetical protein [Solirubrobacteraceae bacterium]